MVIKILKISSLITLGLILLAFGLSFVKAEEPQPKVSISYCSMKTTLDIVYTTIALRKEGYRIPPNITCNNEEGKKLYKLSGLDYKFKDVAGFYFPKFDLIYIKESDVSSIPYTFTHEIGHYNHLRKVGFEKYLILINTPVPKELKSMILEKLGKHATDTEEEFAAEYFALSHLGIKFPEELRKHYEELDGL